MLLENADSAPSSEVAPPSTTAGPTPAVVGALSGAAIQRDVEHLIEIAANLFAAIERQIHSIEVELMLAQSEMATLGNVTVLKERLIQSASALDASMQEIALRLGQSAPSKERSFVPRSTFNN